MSYKTNPIANRIKINKGWKNPYLPIKTLNYARDLSLWFKVYLLLKVFLNLKKIQLVSYEIRFDQENKKLLYLRINKKGTRKKKRKKKETAFNQILKKIQTPLLKNSNSGSKFLLYKNLGLFKNLSFWKKNVVHQKILSKFWLAKPKISTWVNTMEKLMFVRQKTKKSFQNTQTKQNLIPTSHLKLKFYTKKQKQILATFAKIKKKNLILHSKFFEIIQQKQKKNLEILIQNLKKEITKNQIQIQKLSEIYQILTYALKNLSREKKTKKLLKSIKRKKLIFFWKVLKKNLDSLGRGYFFRPKVPTILLQFHKSIFKKTRQKWKFWNKNTILRKIWHLNFLFDQLGGINTSTKNYFLFLNSNTKSRFFRNRHKKKTKKNHFQNNLPIKTFLKENVEPKKKKLFLKQKRTNKFFYNIAAWLWLRKIRKKKFFQSRRFQKKFQKFRRNFRCNLKLKSYEKYNNFLGEKKFWKIKKQNAIVAQIKKTNWDLKTNRIAKHYKYRLPYRRIYLNFQRWNTTFKLKYLIQDFVQKYFHIQVETKIEHVLNAHKNKKFFRLIFPVKKKSTQLIKKQRLDTWNQKQIFLMSRFKLITSAKKKIKKKKRKILNSKQKLKTANVRKILKKKEFFLLTEKKKIKWRMRSYFSRLKKAKDFKQQFKYMMPTLLEFSRTFDPQLLADILSKVILKTKKQTHMLESIKYILQAIQLPKNVGYKIVLTGRINSKKKSRSIYITRKQITLQIFNNKMNYAYSQANARIGAFGVKIWIYSKKNLKNEKNNSLTSK